MVDLYHISKNNSFIIMKHIYNTVVKKINKGTTRSFLSRLKIHSSGKCCLPSINSCTSTQITTFNQEHFSNSNNFIFILKVKQNYSLNAAHATTCTWRICKIILHYNKVVAAGIDLMVQMCMRSLLAPVLEPERDKYQHREPRGAIHYPLKELTGTKWYDDL